MNIDLHCHSNISDGVCSPSQVVIKAHEHGCALLALTDHDNTAGLPEARSKANELGIKFINGVEISVTWRGRTIHIVGLNFDIKNEALQQLLARVRHGRLARFKAIAEKLERKGIVGAYEGGLAYATHKEMASRTHLAQFLIQHHYVRNKAEAFRKHLGDGKSASVKHEWASLDETISAITAAGGVAVIAHPMRYELSTTLRHRLFDDFKTLGGKAIEVHSGRCTLNDRLNYALLADRFQLMASVGSDYHQDNDYGSGLVGACPELPPICRPIWKYINF